MYEDLRQQAFKNYLKNLHPQKYDDPIKRISEDKYHVVIGNVGSGKSSLINFALGTNIEVGIGETTQQCTEVAISENGKIHIFDTRGINEKFSRFNLEVLRFFSTADRIFLLYPDSLRSCRELCLILSKINPNLIYAVRTKCDQWQPTHKKTLEQEIENDRQYLKKQLGLKMEILATSAKRDRKFKDNDMFVKLFKGII